MELKDRTDFAIETARRAGEFALAHFRATDALTIESKGHQDLVSNADRDTETLIRRAIAERFPQDGIIGEEHGIESGTSGFVWVIDPIDGTANFVRGIPQWCVAIACAVDGKAVIGAIFDPVSGEMFSASKGGGAYLNGKPIRASAARSLSEGTVGTGFSARRKSANVIKAISAIVADGGVFFRNASGALMIAYTAAGRLIGYVEEHMNSWDCVAGLLMVEEAGGRILDQDRQSGLTEGMMVVAGGPDIYERIEKIAFDAFGNP